MQKTLRVLSVFLASPNDVAKERVAAVEVIDQVNRSLGNRLGIQLEVLRWEDVRPAYGRPQGAINELVDRCDLFIGILWERWGQSTGEYSSGFYEEFERAKARRGQKGTPDIWLFLKKPRKEKIADPGDQLREVIAFRKRQQESNELLYVEFPVSSKWRSLLLEHLLKYVFDFAQATPMVAEDVVSSTPFMSVSLNSHSDNASPTVRSEVSLANVLMAASRIDLNADDIDFSGVTSIDLFRSFIFVHTLISRRFSGSILETHEVNSIYSLRLNLDLSRFEKQEIFRSLISDSSDVNPGWFWLQGELLSPYDTLVNFARSDTSETVRVNSLKLLERTFDAVPESLWPEFPVTDDSSAVRRAAFRFFTAQKSEQALKYLAGMVLFDKAAQSDLEDARFTLKCAIYPDDALQEVTGKSFFLSKADRALIEARRPKLQERTLLEALDASDGEVRLFCLAELIARGAAQPARLKELLTDPSYHIRALALKRLIDLREISGTDFIRQVMKRDDTSENLWGLGSLLGDEAPSYIPKLEALEEEFFMNQPMEVVLDALDWFSIDGYRAYGALCRRSDLDTISNLRDDLRDGFARIREASYARIRASRGSEITAQYVKAYEKYDSYIRERFEEVALIWLASNAIEGDSEIARKFIDRDFSAAQTAAVQILGKVGSIGDTDSLLAVVKRTHGATKKAAAAAALHSSVNKTDVARELLSVGGEVSAVGFEWLREQNDKAVEDLFLEELGGEDEKARLRAVAFLSKRLSFHELEELMTEYVGRRRYFYNVVTWIDRLLYAPANLREMYVAKLGVEAST